jgi:DNA-binding response OmpR family regulator
MLYSILLVEDDVLVSEILSKKLEDRGHIVHKAYNGELALHKMLRNTPDLIVLDINLPKMSGIDVFLKLKAFYKGPVIFLTGHPSERVEESCLRLGVGDFISKERGFNVFYQRLQRLLGVEPRKTLNNKREKDNFEIKIDDFTYNKKQMLCSYGKRDMNFTNDEFEILYYLLINKNTVVSRDELYMAVKGFPFDGMSRAIDVAISRMKDKLSIVGLDRDLISSKRGRGYILDATKFDSIKI